MLHTRHIMAYCKVLGCFIFFPQRVEAFTDKLLVQITLHHWVILAKALSAHWLQQEVFLQAFEGPSLVTAVIYHKKKKSTASNVGTKQQPHWSYFGNFSVLLLECRQWCIWTLSWSKYSKRSKAQECLASEGLWGAETREKHTCHCVRFIWAQDVYNP